MSPIAERPATAYQAVGMPAPMRVESVGPTEPSSRVATLDLIRGVALFGVLYINLQSSSGAWGTPETAVDQAVKHLTNFFVYGSFYALFTILFGVGFAAMMDRSAGKATPFASLYVRRLAWLFVIGALHYVLIWDGDVLRSYAYAGLFLLVLPLRSVRSALAWSAAFMAFAIGKGPITDAIVAREPAAVVSSVDSARLAETAAQARQLRDEYRQSLRTGDYGDVVQKRSKRLFRSYANMRWPVDAYVGFVLSMFCLGVAGWRWRILDAPAHTDRTRALARLATISAIVGVAGNAIVVATAVVEARGGELSLPPGANGAASFLGDAGLAITYGCLLILLVNDPRSRVSRMLAPIGRMALSNYLLQSLIFTTLFYGYAFGQHGRFGIAATLALSIAVFAVQIPLSRWWLDRFRFGPAEWAWRSLVYRARQAMTSG